jgi:hypothetical protein
MDGPEVSFKSTRIERNYLRENLREFDIVHFAGHVESTGLELADGPFGPGDLDALSGGMPMPRLVFLNGCASASADGERTDNLALSLLDAGVQHTVGALYGLPDHLARDLAVTFYQHLARGVTVGESLRQARLALTSSNDASPALWASYLLYGDPTAVYPFGSACEVVGHDSSALELLQFEAPSAGFQTRISALPTGSVPMLRRQAVGTLPNRIGSLNRSILQAFLISVALLLVGFIGIRWAQEGAPAVVAADRPADESRPREAPGAVGVPVPEVQLSIRDASEFSPARRLHNGSSATAGGRLSLTTQLVDSAFLYVLRVTPGRIDRLWPPEDNNAWLPEGEHALSGGEHPWRAGPQPGFESVVIAVRAAPWNDFEYDLEQFARRRSEHGLDSAASDAGRLLSTQSATQELRETLMARGAEVEVVMYEVLP